MQNSETKKRIYRQISQELKAILEEKMPWESALVSAIAIIKEKLNYASWVGFYRNYDGHLWAGPYQGKLACTHIPPGKGVCGRSLKEQKIIIVKDVNNFPGHIACDSLSQSEIVLPVWRNKDIVGVLDLDSHSPSAFDKTDELGLSEILTLISENSF